MKMYIYRAILSLKKGETIRLFGGCRYYLSRTEAEEDNVLFLQTSANMEGTLETVREEIVMPEVLVFFLHADLYFSLPPLSTLPFQIKSVVTYMFFLFFLFLQGLDFLHQVHQMGCLVQAYQDMPHPRSSHECLQEGACAPCQRAMIRHLQPLSAERLAEIADYLCLKIPALPLPSGQGISLAAASYSEDGLKTLLAARSRTPCQRFLIQMVKETPVKTPTVLYIDLTDEDEEEMQGEGEDAASPLPPLASPGAPHAPPAPEEAAAGYDYTLPQELLFPEFDLPTLNVYDIEKWLYE
jgi:hypothetical protein